MSIKISGSWGFLSNGSLKKITMSIYQSATLDAICATPPIRPENNFSTSKPAASALAPVVPVATRF